MRTKKFGLVLAMIAALSMVLPVHAETLATTSEATAVTASVSGGDVSGGDVTGGDVTPTPTPTPTPDSEVDLSGKTVNLALVVDITGSMSGYISGVKENLTEFVRFIESTGVKFRISLIDYRDITCDEPTKVHTFDGSVWCENADQMVDALNALRVNGGGDYEETVIDALGYVVDDETMTFNSDAAKFAVVLTDADYKVDNIHGIADMDDMIARLNAKGIKVSVMTDEWCFSDYEALTTATGGILCPVYDFGAALQDYAVSIIKATADTEVDESLKVVTSIEASGPACIRPGYGYTYTVKINPADATEKGIFWATEDASVAEVAYATGTECTVIGVAEGTTNLVAVSKDGGYTSKVAITVSADGEAPKDDTFMTSDYDTVKDAIAKAGVKKIEYCVGTDETVSATEQKELFTALKGTEKTMSFAFSDGNSREKTLLYKWTFFGGDITDPGKTIDFAAEIGKGIETKDMLEAGKKVADGKSMLDIHFEHSGTLPGKASVTVNVMDMFKADSKLNLYYYNPTTGKLEEMATGISIVDGYATFPLEHCSDYLLVNGDLKDGEDQDDDDDDDDDDSTASASADKNLKSPKTGDKGVTGFMLMAMISLFGLVFLGKKVRE